MLIRKKPNCRTVEFWRLILQNYPSDKAVIRRTARRFNRLKCQTTQKYALKRLLIQVGEQLSIKDAVTGYLGSPVKSVTTVEPPKPIPRLQVQKGFYVMGDYRASLSPSKRYLSVGQSVEQSINDQCGTMTVWDLKTGYIVNSLPCFATFLSAFLTDRYLLVATPVGLQVLDLIENKQFPLCLVGFPTFLVLSPDKKQLVINNPKDEVTLYEIKSVSNHIAPVTLIHKHLLTDVKAQAGQFIDNQTLLLGNQKGELFLYDIAQKKVLSSISLNIDKMSAKIKGDVTFDIFRVLKGGFWGIRQIVVSEDRQRYAVLADKQLVLVERNAGKLNVIQTITREKSINSFGRIYPITVNGFD